MGTPANIVVGAPANIKIGAYGAVEGACVDVGYTEGGCNIVPSLEYYRAKADQSLGTLKVKCTGREFVVQFDMAEPTLTNLYKALGLPVASLISATHLAVGNDATVTEYVLFINGNAPSSGTRKIECKKCVPIGEPEVKMLKNNKTVYACKFLVLEDPTQAAGYEFMDINDSGVDTTPPTVAMTTPAEDGTVTKATSDPVILTFTEAGAGIDESTLVDGVSLIVMDVTDHAQNVKVAGTWSYVKATKVLTFVPTAVWTTVHKHCVIVNNGVKDIAGNKLATVYVSNFTVT